MNLQVCLRTFLRLTITKNIFELKSVDVALYERIQMVKDDIAYYIIQIA